VATCLDQARQVTTQGAELLSSDEIAQLERTSNKLKSRYERACDRSDKLLRRLMAAQDELSKFR
jgi:dystonin